MLWIVTYDVVEDRRRAAVADLLAQWGARVQLSVFECEFGQETTASEVAERLADLIDEVEDQVRVYRLWRDEAKAVTIIGRRTLEERHDFWII